MNKKVSQDWLSKIAREAVFGSKTMAECTPFGTRELKALDVKKLQSIKRAIQTFFPCYQAEFEGIWRACVDAIGQACKFERKRK